MKKLPIHNRAKEVVAYTLVDNDDYAWASKSRWRLVVGKRNLYVARAVGKTTFYLHRLIMGVLQTSKTLDVDHINHDSLDNQKANLRVCTRAENLQNSRKHLGKEGVKGVSRSGKKWRFQRMINGVREVRTFKTKEEAESYAQK